MASTYTPLGVELQATGENAGTWGTKTNTNLQIIEQISGGYTTQAVSDSGDTTLSVSDGSTGATLSHRVIEFTGSLTASRNVTIPLDVQNFYFLKNATSGSQNVVFKYVTGTGTSATVASGKTVIAYAKADDGTNPNIPMQEFGGDVVDDTSPQLGGDLDVNGNGLVSTSNGNIALTPNGTGVVRIDGSNGIDIQSGSISIKNSGTQSYVDFYCESSNAHYARLQAPAHSAFSGNITLTLPATTDTVAGIAATQTLTNKTLTTPTIAEIDSGSTITLDATTDIVLDAGGADVIFKDDGTSILTLTNNSTDVDFTVATQDKDINFKGDDGGSGITALSLDMSDAGTAVFNHDIRIADDGQIGSASDADAMTISASGVVTFSQAPVFPDGVVPLVDLDIDGGTDIGADLTTSDLIIVDDGAGGTNRKAALSRLTTFMTGQGFSTDDPTALAIALG